MRKLDIRHFILSVVIGCAVPFILVKINYIYIYENREIFLLIISLLFFMLAISNIIKKIKIINNSDNIQSIYAAKLSLITIGKAIFIFILAIFTLYAFYIK